MAVHVHGRMGVFKRHALDCRQMKTLVIAEKPS
ncbi:MAG: hypothetical protein ACJA1Y_000827, partial [Burkholderiaceae bacterium]